MAYPKSIRAKVEIAAACGVPVSEIVKAFGASKTTVNCWLNPRRKQSQLEACRKWRKENPDKAKEANRAWYYANIDKARALARNSMKTWRVNNPEAAREKDRRNYRKQYAKCPEYFAEKSMARHRNTWKIPLTLAERREIQQMLRDARRLFAETGEPYEVDHIWPVSRGGWHHPANMRVISKAENRKKGSQLPTLEEMLRNTRAEEIP